MYKIGSRRSLVYGNLLLLSRSRLSVYNLVSFSLVTENGFVVPERRNATVSDVSAHRHSLHVHIRVRGVGTGAISRCN